MDNHGLFATAYMPPVAYMAALAHCEHVAIEGQETYPKQTYRNRCTILTANGLLDLTVPVSRPQGNHTRTAEITISYAEPWNIRHWRAIESAYSAAPYFLYYRDGIEQILRKQHTRLIELNHALTLHLLKKLKINSELTFTEDYQPHPDASDFRNTFSPKCPLPSASFSAYNQVFGTKFPFQPNLSILDLLFNLGPEARSHLLSLPTF